MKNEIFLSFSIGAGVFAIMTLITYLLFEDKLFSIVCFFGAMFSAMLMALMITFVNPDV